MRRAVVAAATAHRDASEVAQADILRPGSLSRRVRSRPPRSPLFVPRARWTPTASASRTAIHESVRDRDPYLTEIASHLVVAGGKRLRPVVAIAAAQVAGRRPPTTSCGAAWRASSSTSARCTTTTSWTRPTPAAASRPSTPSGATCRRSSPATSCWRRASEIAASLGTEVAGLLARTIGWLCEGQIEQLRHTYDIGRAEDSYFDVDPGQDGVAVRTAARIGGIVAGLDRPTDRRAHRVRRRATGWCSRSSTTCSTSPPPTEQLGKPAGHDMVEGVYTLPVLRTLAAGRRAADELRSLLGRPLELGRAGQGAGHRPLQRGRRERAPRRPAATSSAAEATCADLPAEPGHRRPARRRPRPARQRRRQRLTGPPTLVGWCRGRRVSGGRRRGPRRSGARASWRSAAWSTIGAG